MKKVCPVVVLSLLVGISVLAGNEVDWKNPDVVRKLAQAKRFCLSVSESEQVNNWVKEWLEQHGYTAVNLCSDADVFLLAYPAGGSSSVHRATVFVSGRNPATVTVIPHGSSGGGLVIDLCEVRSSPGQRLGDLLFQGTGADLKRMLEGMHKAIQKARKKKDKPW